MAHELSRNGSGRGPLLPGLAVLRRYERPWLRGDVVGGVTVAAYLVPQVMAYAAVAGLDPVVGLWASVGPLLVYTFLGSSRGNQRCRAGGIGQGAAAQREPR